MIKKSFFKATLFIALLSSTSAFSHSARDVKMDVPDNIAVQNSFSQQTLDLLSGYNKNNKSDSEAHEIVLDLIDHQKNVISGKLSSIDSDLPNNSSILYDNLLAVFADIGKSEHIERLLYAYKIAGASADERKIITIVG